MERTLRGEPENSSNLYMLDDFGKKTAPQFSHPFNGDSASPRITKCEVLYVLYPTSPHPQED